MLRPSRMRAATRARTRTLRSAITSGLAALALIATAACGDAVSPGAMPGGSAGEISYTPLALTSLAVGGAHSCGLTPLGAPYCWGRNADGQLGDGTQADRAEPTRVAGTEGLTFTAIAAGYAHTCATTSDGAMYCWGRNGSGQLGDGTFARKLVPTLVPNLTVEGMALGDAHTCAWATVLAERVGLVSCWGDNSFGQLGDGTLDVRNVPTPITGPLTSARLVTAGGAHTCAFLGEMASSATLHCWGSNDFRQIDGTQNWWRTVATAPNPMPDVVSVSAGSWHSCGLNAAGEATCWGYNFGGQLGFTSGEASGPAAVGGNHVFASIDVGDRTSCARTSTGETWCWGANDEGQLGDGTQTASIAPVQVSGAAFGTIGVGDAHACGLDAQGEAWCWGDNKYGQLGDGTQERKLTPVRVMLAVLQ